MSAHPAEGERYFLRVLLNHIPGSKSFEDLRTVDGELCDNFCEAAERKGLVEADDTLDESLTKSEQYAMPASLRRLKEKLEQSKGCACETPLAEVFFFPGNGARKMS
jgi:hypothetical protein